MLRFAPRYGIVAPALVRPSRQRRRFACNDNQLAVAAAIAHAPIGVAPLSAMLTPANTDPCDSAATICAPAALGDARVQAALRLFATHGLSAAARARREAANADARGDEPCAQWWTAISHILA